MNHDSNTTQGPEKRAKCPQQSNQGKEGDSPGSAGRKEFNFITRVDDPLAHRVEAVLASIG